MQTTKLTLSANPRLIQEAKRLAKQGNTSVSALFARYIESLSRGRDEDMANLSPITRKALGMVRLPKVRSYKRILEDSLLDKYGFRK
ncbi:MAG: hypothetical protein HZB26_09585 [Candidatus Hydrogenedentes bacterium]|nr:hypothetical protein [Candidatus Hydrogenedentota bacterium]